MGRNIVEINDLLRFIIRKERGAFITIEEADDALDAGQLDAFSDYFKSYGETQQVHDALRPFRVRQSFTSDANGLVAFEDDYLHILPDVYTVTGSTINKVRFVNEDEFVTAITSQLRPVSTSRPIAKDASTGFYLYPETAQSGFYTYLRRPAKPTYAYSIVDRVVTYDENASQQIEFSDIYINNIIAKALKYFAINLAEQDISQFAEMQDFQTR
jgi:hypothetical protein